MSDPQTPPPAPPATPPTPAAAPAPTTVRYAVYDTRYLKFVGEVTAKKPSKSAAKELVGHDDFDIREV